MPGLVLSEVGLERYIPDDGISEHITRDINIGGYRNYFDLFGPTIGGTSYGAPAGSQEMSAYYTGVLDAFKTGTRILWAREIWAIAGIRSYMGDVHRFFFTNLTSHTIELPVEWVNESKWGRNNFWWDGTFHWVELGRFVQEGDGWIRETAARFTPPGLEIRSYNGALQVPPGEWDLNFCIGTYTRVESATWYDGLAYSTLRIPQLQPDPDHRSRRRRAAWMNMERPIF